MADVGDIHHLLYPVAAPLEIAAQNIRKQKRTQIADMRVIIDRRLQLYIATFPSFCAWKLLFFLVRIIEVSIAFS